MYLFPYRQVNVRQLNEELAALNLPNFIGTGVIPRDGVIVVKVGELTEAELAPVAAKIEAHVYIAPVPPADIKQTLRGEVAESSLSDAAKAILRRFLSVL